MLSSLMVVTILLADGMFMDGQLYSCVARNIAIGDGSWWFPYYAYDWFRNGNAYFLEQPATAHWVQALFFKIIGDRPLTEEFYALCTCLLNIWLIHKIWRLVFSTHNNIKQLSWLPVLLWMVIPVVHWTQGNNLMENAMTVCCLASTYFYFKSSDSAKYRNLFLVGLFACLAFFSKGFPGLFVMGLPFVAFVTIRKQSFTEMLKNQLFLIGVIVLLFGSLFLFETPRTSLLLYLEGRVLNSIKNVSNVGSRFHLVGVLFLQLSPLIALMGIALGFRKKIAFDTKTNAMALLFLALGICASIPLLVTKEQRTFYLATSMPFYAFGFAVLFVPHVQKFQTRFRTFFQHDAWTSKAPILFVVLMLVGPMTIVDTSHRDLDKLEIVQLVGDKIGNEAIISSAPKTWGDFKIKAYFQRQYRISFDRKSNREYYLLDTRLGVQPPEEYQKTEIATANYMLYKK